MAEINSCERWPCEPPWPPVGTLGGSGGRVSLQYGANAFAGAITAYAARMAEATGFKALYLSGGGVAGLA